MRRGRAWLALLLWLAVLLGRLWAPVGAQTLRRELEKLLETERESAAAVQAMGRALSGENRREELITALKRLTRETEAEA